MSTERVDTKPLSQKMHESIDSPTALFFPIEEWADKVAKLERECAEAEALRKHIQELEAIDAGRELMDAEADDFLAGKVVIDASELEAKEERIRLLEQPDLSGRMLPELLRDAAEVLHQYGGGPLEDCLRAKALQIEELPESDPGGET